MQRGSNQNDIKLYKLRNSLKERSPAAGQDKYSPIRIERCKIQSKNEYYRSANNSLHKFRPKQTNNIHLRRIQKIKEKLDLMNG